MLARPLSPRQPPPELPHIWRVQDLAAEAAAIPSGHAALDAQLPGGGWPAGGMVELLQARGGPHAWPPTSPHVWQLLLPALARAVREQAGPVVLVGAPLEPFGPGLAAQGLPGERLLCVRVARPAARLWAAGQALRCADVAAVLAWLPQATSAELRRLQMAAQAHGRLLFVLREPAARHEASPARLRLLIDGVDELRVHILKRRGPPLETPVLLPAHPARLAALLAVRQGSGRTASLPAPLAAQASPPRAPASPSRTTSLERSPHGLDRIAALP